MYKSEQFQQTGAVPPTSSLELVSESAGTHFLFEQPHWGDTCPHCEVERLDYDGLLNLSCPACGIISSGCFT
jgi:hypothetical protein